MMAGRVSFRREQPGVNGGEQRWQGGGSRRSACGELTVKEEVHTPFCFTKKEVVVELDDS